MVSATTSDEGADAALTLGRARSGREVFRGDDLGTVMDQSTGTSTALLLEDAFAAHVIDTAVAVLPLDLVVGRKDTRPLRLCG